MSRAKLLCDRQDQLKQNLMQKCCSIDDIFFTAYKDTKLAPTMSVCLRIIRPWQWRRLSAYRWYNLSISDIYPCTEDTPRHRQCVRLPMIRPGMDDVYLPYDETSFEPVTIVRHPMICFGPENICPTTDDTFWQPTIYVPQLIIGPWHHWLISPLSMTCLGSVNVNVRLQMTCLWLRQYLSD